MTKHHTLGALVDSRLLSSATRSRPRALLCTRCISHLTSPIGFAATQTPFPRTRQTSRITPHSSRRAFSSGFETKTSTVEIPAGLAEQHTLVIQLFNDVTKDPAESKKIPDEKSIMRVLATYERLVERLVADSHHPEASPGTPRVKSATNATSAVLKSMKGPRTGSQITAAEVLAEISSRATQIIEAPQVFISAPVLKSYINLQSQLGCPQNFPAIFDLYSNKPTPRPSAKEPYMTLAPPNPNAASVAVDPAVASTALAAGVKLHSLPLCLDIVDSTYCAPAYAKGKILRNAIVPIAGAVFAPAAAYALATKFALIQNTMDPAHATTVAMAGIVTYIATIGTMGYIAVTTSNDQMVRVTWATGTPLWERWVREEERAAVDRVAQAWGFRNRVRWGDEEGPEWDTLREWAGMKGMVLDRVELMQGMQ